MDALDEQRIGSRRRDLIAPCFGCREREPGCHDRCIRYAAFKGTLEVKRKYEEANKDNIIYDKMEPKWRRGL